MKHRSDTLIWATALASALTLGTAGSAVAQGIDELPPEIAEAYEGLDPEQPVGPSAYRDFEPNDGPPWTIGYASSYAGNTWRAEALSRLLDDLLPRYQEAGLVDEIIVTQSDLDDSTQIQQMRQLVDQGVDAIIICCSNVTALNQTVEYAYNQGVPTFSWSGYVTSPFAINTSANYTQGGYQIGQWMAEEIGGSGRLLLVSGIPGAASSDSFDNGVMRALEEYPDIEIAGTVAGMWTDQVAQVEVQRFLATNPGDIDGIIAQSASETGVLRALLQSGRPMVPISIGGQAGASCYWRNNPDWISQGFHIWPPGDEMEMAFDVMIRTLQGQGPKVQSIIRPIGTYSHDDVVEALPEDCTIDSTDWLQPGPDSWFPPEMADAYFLRPEHPLEWSASE
jgi:ribose transport system substrate-binding protein